MLRRPANHAITIRGFGKPVEYGRRIAFADMSVFKCCRWIEPWARPTAGVVGSRRARPNLRQDVSAAGGSQWPITTTRITMESRISGTAAKSPAAAWSDTAPPPARWARPCWCRHRGNRRSARPSRTRSARCSRCRARPPPAARPRWSAARWRLTASTRPAASTAGRSSSSSPTTNPSPTSAAARPRSSWSRTRSTLIKGDSSRTSALRACRCSKSTRSST